MTETILETKFCIVATVRCILKAAAAAAAVVVEGEGKELFSIIKC
jgi:hypothetical protein